MVETPDPQAAGRAWMRGELADDAYLAIIRRNNQPPIRDRIRAWLRRRRGTRQAPKG